MIGPSDPIHRSHSAHIDAAVNAIQGDAHVRRYRQSPSLTRVTVTCKGYFTQDHSDQNTLRVASYSETVAACS